MVKYTDKPLPVRCLIDEALIKRLESWGRELAKKPAVAVHYGESLPLSYAARTALLIGAEELKECDSVLFDEYTLEGVPHPINVAIPLWFLAELDILASRYKVSRLQVIRSCLNKGLPL